jgi:hypothetical protein
MRMNECCVHSLFDIVVRMESRAAQLRADNEALIEREQTNRRIEDSRTYYRWLNEPATLEQWSLILRRELEDRNAGLILLPPSAPSPLGGHDG